jgi:hypothetical protein
VPLVNAQVGDQNGIPPTDALIGFLIGSENVTASSYNDYVTLIEGTNITIDVNHANSELTFNSVGGGGAPASIHLIGNVTNSGCAENEILQVNSTGFFDCATAGAGGGETNTASNLNEGYGIFGSKVGFDLQFKSLLNGSGIVITQNSTNIMLNSTSTRDQIHWARSAFQYNEGNIWFLLDGDYTDNPSGSIDDWMVPVTKPIYLDYMEFYFAQQDIPTGTWDMRVLEGVLGTNISGDRVIDLSTVSAGDTVRIEWDLYVPAGSVIMIDGECTSNIVCTPSGSAIFGATLEFYAVNDAMDFPGWEFQDDNLGDHTATSNLDMDGNSIQNTAFYEVDGTVAGVGELRMSFGDSIAWRNSLGTDDIYIETLGLDVLGIQINTEQVAVFSTSDLDLQNNNLEIGSGRVGFDDFDTAIQQDGSDLDLRTGGSVIVEISGGAEYDFSSTAADFNDNSLKGSLGCSDGEAITYQSSGDIWICGAAGGGGSKQTMIYNADPILTVAKGVTTFIGFGSASSSAENDVRIPMGDAGTASRLECEVNASGTNADTQIMVRKNNNNTALTLSYGSGVTGILNDNVNDFTFNQNDRIDIRVINNSSGGGAKDFDLQHCSFLVVYD